jgi:disulfide bond formation protein DsbB
MKLLQRWGLYFAWLIVLISVLGSLYWSTILKIEPCTLCWYQRIFLFPLGILLGIAAYRRDSLIIPYALSLSVTGGIFAAYHVLLQKKHLFPHFCSSGVKCTEEHFLVFGIFSPAMLSFFTFLLISTLLFFSRKKRAQKS